jgi:outer membrane protein assembly factor BamB
MTLALFTALPAFAGNWPNWRGPEGNGVSTEKSLPLKWSDAENVRWRVELPGPGNSSPIIWGERVFVSQYVKKEDRRVLLCFDLASGKLRWQSGVTYTERESTQENNPYCAGTPATDGERVYVCFGSPGVFAYDLDGKELWHRDLGKLNHVFGTAVSPLLYGDLCIVNFGPDEKARLLALNKKTGETIWEAEPPKPDESERQQEMRGFAGGGGGPGGRGGFGPGPMLASQILSQADKNGDQKVSRNEFSALAEVWFAKIDAEKTGKVSQEQFTEKIADVLIAPAGGSGDRRGGPGGGGPGRFVGPGLFTAVDMNKDGSLTLAELKGTFEKWAAEWDSDKSGSLTEEKLRNGLTAALPRPNFGGPGNGGRGPGGPGGPGGRGGGGGNLGGSWSTPIIVRANGHDELVVAFAFRLAGLDPRSGKQLWFSKGLGGTIYTTPLLGEGLIVASSGGMGGGNAIAIKPGGSGEVSEKDRVWRLERIKSGFGSGVIHEGRLYTISQDGIVECFELASGKSVWQERLRGKGAQGSSWSSMLLADGKIYVPNKSGDVFVLRAAPRFEVLATNSVGEQTNASLAAADNAIFLRTHKALWCFANLKNRGEAAGHVDPDFNRRYASAEESLR